MSLGLCFWIIMLVWFIFFLLIHFGAVGGVYAAGASTLLLFVLFLILGWQVFGPPLHR